MFYRGTVEFRCFNSTLHAGKAAAYVNLCLAIFAQAINQRSTVMRKTKMEPDNLTDTQILRYLDEFKRNRPPVVRQKRLSPPTRLGYI